MKFALVAGVVLLSGATTGQRDISGQWVVRQDRDFRGNRGAPADCAFTQQQHALRVRCGGAGAMTGHVHGTRVTWSVDMTDVPPMKTDHLVLTYSGALNAAGDRIAGKWSLRSRLSGIDESGTFEAKRKP